MKTVSIRVSINFETIALNVPESQIEEKKDDLIQTLESLMVDKCDYQELMKMAKFEIKTEGSNG